MARPAGVTASAVVALIGSVLTLLMAVFLAFLPAFSASSTATVTPRELLVVGLVMAAISAAFGAWGLFTAIGLLKLKKWARISTIVYAALLTLFSGLAVVAMATVPLPDAPQPGQPAGLSLAAMRPMIVTIYAIPLLVGIWWLVYFNLKVTRDAFATEYVPGPPSARPLSISIIGWWMAVGGPVSVFLAMLPLPFVFAGAYLTGGAARLGYLFVGGLAGWLGWGLLKLRESARIGMLAYVALSVANSLYYALTDSGRAALQRMQRDMTMPGMPPAAPDESVALTIVMMLFGATVAAVAVWFLVKHRAVFDRGGDVGGGSPL